MLKNSCRQIMVLVGTFCLACVFMCAGSTMYAPAHAKDMSLEEAVEKTAGLWFYKKGDEVRFYYLGASLKGFADDGSSAVELDADSNIIIRLTTTSPVGTVVSETYKVDTIKENRIVLFDSKGENFVLKRSKRDILGLAVSLQYRERVALPENVEVYAWLYAGENLVASASFNAKGNTPIPFSLYFIGNKKKLEEQYLTLQATISHDGEDLFTTLEPVEVEDDFIFVSAANIKRAPRGDKEGRNDREDRRPVREEDKELNRPENKENREQSQTSGSHARGILGDTLEDAKVLDVLLYQAEDELSGEAQKKTPLASLSLTPTGV